MHGDQIVGEEDGEIPQRFGSGGNEQKNKYQMPTCFECPPSALVFSLLLLGRECTLQVLQYRYCILFRAGVKLSGKCKRGAR